MFDPFLHFLVSYIIQCDRRNFIELLTLISFGSGSHQNSFGKL